MNYTRYEVPASFLRDLNNTTEDAWFIVQLCHVALCSRVICGYVF